jgi:ABC-2 type transport system ATP-binding protein
LEYNSRVEIYSEDLTDSPKELKQIFGIVPEISNAYSDYTVWQNLNFSGTIYGLTKSKIKERVSTLLDRFELADKLYAKTKTLSKGLKQRLNLCLALLHEPSILILDEPTSGLDPFSVSIVRNQILQLKKEGKTILISTHNMQEAQQICDRILIINRGNIIADETPDKLRNKVKPFSTIVFNIESKLSLEQRTNLISQFNVKEGEKNMFHIITDNPLHDISNINDFSKKNSIKITNFKLLETSLEEVFIHLIKNDSKNKRGYNNEL